MPRKNKYVSSQRQKPQHEGWISIYVELENEAMIVTVGSLEFGPKVWIPMFNRGPVAMQSLTDSDRQKMHASERSHQIIDGFWLCATVYQTITG